MIRAELLQDATDALLVARALETDANFSRCTQFVRLLQDSNCGFQEKHNGDRRIIEKQGNSIKDYNRNGEPGKGLPECIKAILRAHPLPMFVIDTELVGDQIFVFDALYLGDEAIVAKPYSYRETSYRSQFSGYDNHIVPVATARTTDEKMALIVRLKGEDAEGFVTKDLRAPYRPAVNNQRYNYRYKFWKTLDAVVIGDSTKRVDGKLRDSVRIGCYDSNGVLKDICGSTKKSAFVLKPGDVIEIKYLYGTSTLDVVQPTILRQRFDKSAKECVLTQIIVNKNFKKVAYA